MDDVIASDQNFAVIFNPGPNYMQNRPSKYWQKGLAATGQATFL